MAQRAGKARKPRAGKARKPKKPEGLLRSCLATLPQIAAALGPGERTLRRLQAEGVIVPVVAGRGRRPAEYDLHAVARALIGQPDNPRDEKDRAVAELTRLRIAKLRGELVMREAADAALATMQAGARAAILRLPTDAIRRGVSREHEPLLRELAEGVLSALASRKWAA